jgi:hypothetical protein
LKKLLLERLLAKLKATALVETEAKWFALTFALVLVLDIEKMKGLRKEQVKV